MSSGLIRRAAGYRVGVTGVANHETIARRFGFVFVAAALLTIQFAPVEEQPNRTAAAFARHFAFRESVHDFFHALRVARTADAVAGTV